jgi:hypothetical protein
MQHAARILRNTFRAMTDAGLPRATSMQHCRTMADQLDLEPDQEVVALYRALRRS